jgi:hypothetical protein
MDDAACSEMRVHKMFQLENRQRKWYLGEVKVYWEDIKMDPKETGMKV